MEYKGLGSTNTSLKYVCDHNFASQSYSTPTFQGHLSPTQHKYQVHLSNFQQQFLDRYIFLDIDIVHSGDIAVLHLDE
jgi:hypothetical protein